LGRIRTVKPELFTSEGLYDLEVETGLPIRIAFVGMFCQADREGRFKWRPRALKSQILPYDDIDFPRVLDALLERGYLDSYEINGEKYGVIPKFLQHQFINNKEIKSCLPPPEIASQYNSLTRDSRVAHALTSRGVKERKGKERNINTNTTPISKALPSKKESPVPKMSPPPYKEKIKQVMDYYKSLSTEEKQKFYNSAIHQRKFGTTTPGRGTTDEGALLIEWYDKTVD